MQKKKIFLVLGITTVAMAMGVMAYAANKVTPFEQSRSTDDKIRTLVLDHSNAPAELPNNFQAGTVVSSSFRTAENNDIPLHFALAKASDTGFATLGNHGAIYNFGAELGRFKGIVSIQAVFTGSLTFKYGNYELQNGGAYLDSKYELTDAEYELPSPARYFSLSAGDAKVEISSITIKYSCSGDPSSFPGSQVYNVEDFQSYDGEGQGYDGGHGASDQTKLRASFYSTYKGSVADDAAMLNGSGWSLMGGSYDYMYLTTTKGHNDSKAGLFKVNNGNNFRYISNQVFYGIPAIIGKGSQLSLWLHGAYTEKTASTDYTAGIITVKIFALYNSKFNTSGANTADIAEYTLFPNSGWNEYTLNLDPSKEYYGWGIFFAKLGSGTAYIPVDDVAIKTPSTAKTSPSGTYEARVNVRYQSYNFTVPVLISFAEKAGTLAVRCSNEDVNPVYASCTINNLGNFTIPTSGSYEYSEGPISISATYGIITGNWNPSLDVLENISFSGTIKNYLPDNGSITLSIPTLSLNCDGDNITLRQVFKRQYYDGNNWSVDGSNADRIVSNIVNVATGKSALSPRVHSSYRTGVVLTNSIDDTTCESFSMWVYNPSGSTVKSHLAVYKVTNTTAKTDDDRYTFATDVEFAPGWSFFCRGFTHKTLFIRGTHHLRNIMINMAPGETRLTFDCMTIYY